MFAILFQRPTKKGASPVVPFRKKLPVSVILDDADEDCHNSGACAGKHGPRHQGDTTSRTSKGLKSSPVRKLFRQHESLLGRQAAADPVSLRRCISAGGTKGSTDHGASSASKVKQVDSGKAFSVEVKKASAVASSASSSSDGSSICSFSEALESVTVAAANTACALSSARQQHEEALLKQREQFQLLMQTLARSQATAPAPASSATASGISETNTRATSGFSAATPSPQTPSPAAPPQQPYLQLHPAPVPTSATECYRGVHFAIPLGCRVEDGEGPTEVLVTGPNVNVVLQLRDGGRKAQLVSSNCVCTVKRMGGRVTVHVLPPLAARANNCDTPCPSIQRL